jgi:putative resolvase
LLGDADAPTVCYARVSSHDQKEDLQHQQDMLEAYCAAKSWRTEVITHKDRLLRLGAELVFALCEVQGIEIIIIHKGEQPRFEEELAKDVLEIITVFSARLYGSRSHKNK